MPRQFVVCKFRASDTRTFTYHNDGEPVHDGDTVRVPDPRSDGFKKVFVVSTTDEVPAFTTKPILGLHTEDEPTPIEAAAPAAPGDALATPLPF